MKWGIFIGAAIGLLSLYILFYYFIYEGFQTAGQNYRSALNMDRGSVRFMANGVDQETACKAVMATIATGPDQGKPDVENTVNKCAACLDIAGCGWAPITGGATGVGACIPRQGQYPISPQFLVDYLRTSITKGLTRTFNTAAFASSKNQCVGSCSSIKNCKDCVSGQSVCSWSLSAAGSGGSTMGACVDAGSTTNGTAYIGGGQSAQCPMPACSTITDCVACSQQVGCGFCGTTSKCISVNGMGQDSSNGSTTCPQASIILQAYQCPCEGITDCATCAARPGCGFCKAEVKDPRNGSSTAKCKNLLDYNTGKQIYLSQNGADGTPVGNIDNLCPPDGFLTSASQCTPSPRQMGNMRDESGNYRPGAAELGMTGDNTALFGNNIDLASQGGSVIGTGSGAVSAARTWTTASGNGNVVPLGARMPSSMWNSGDLYANPLESYVKLLVRSELASEGVPVNEPFQVNEMSAIGNATDYMKGVFRGVFTGSK